MHNKILNLFFIFSMMYHLHSQPTSTFLVDFTLEVAAVPNKQIMTSFFLVFFTAIVVVPQLLKVSRFSSVSALLSSPLSVPLKYAHHRSNCFVRYEYSHYTTTTRSTRSQMTIDDNDDDDDDDDDNDDGINTSNDSNYSNPIENETPEQRKNRMKMVRKIQRSFYQNEEPIQVPTSSMPSENDNDNDDEKDNNDETDFTIIKNLPLWRVQWTELPGSQNILNVHVPHYTNMFQKILQGKTISWGTSSSSSSASSDSIPSSFSSPNNNKKDLYFGHIYLPGGSENLDDELYKLLDATDATDDGQEKENTKTKTTMASLTGVLMRISDHRQMDDGRLVLIVQAIEKFKIHKVIRSHSPYAIADVKIYPDKEQIEEKKQIEIFIGNDNDNDNDNDKAATAKAKAASSRAVVDAFAMHPFEVRAVSIKECEVHNKNGEVGIAISPLSNYDSNNNNYNHNFIQRRNNNDDTKTSTIIPTSKELVALAEYNTWVKLDELLKLLRIASQGEGVTVPVPSQILGLLPRLPRQRVVKEEEEEEEEEDNDIITTTSSSSSSSSSNQLLVWPTNFELDKVVSSIEGEQYINTLSPSAVVGTYSKSPFVRVDDYCCNDDYDIDDDDDDGSGNDTDTNCACYSPLRRAQRFSYVVWSLTESIALNQVDVDRYSRQSILEIDSTKERLELAIEKMEKICILIRQVLRQTRGL